MTTPADILAFWFEDDRTVARKTWFQRDDAFDAAIRDRFGATTEQAAAGALDAWAETPDGALALLIALDQFPRNLHRGTARAFAADERARRIAREVVLNRRWDLPLSNPERTFLYLPFEHSEDMRDQDLSVALFEGAMRDDPERRAPGSNIDYAWQHWLVIRRFGRFPHRNAALGRESTPEELAYLAEPGAGF
ncbi:MAG TPA: DUF924 family protein [Acetobacteraceae bacterium]|nr:DUF924 family protein [Acetobacteraceae bacterium]